MSGSASGDGMTAWKTDGLIRWAGHASFILSHEGKRAWIDPFRISGAADQKADLVLITHPHFDHYSEADMAMVAQPGCTVVAPRGCVSSKRYKVVELSPGAGTLANGIGIEAVPAYNTHGARLQFHPKSNNWLGFIVTIGGKRIYHAGDTDAIEEMGSLPNIDYALLPIGGTYTMDVEEALKAAEMINARHVVPMHYKALLGREGAAKALERFKGGAANALPLEEIQEPAYSF